MKSCTAEGPAPWRMEVSSGTRILPKTSFLRVHPHDLKWQKRTTTTKCTTKQTEKRSLACYSERLWSLRIKSAFLNKRRDKLLVYFNHTTCFLSDLLLTARHWSQEAKALTLSPTDRGELKDCCRPSMTGKSQKSYWHTRVPQLTKGCIFWPVHRNNPFTICDLRHLVFAKYTIC